MCHILCNVSNTKRQTPNTTTKLNCNNLLQTKHVVGRVLLGDKVVSKLPKATVDNGGEGKRYDMTLYTLLATERFNCGKLWKRYGQIAA